MRIRDRIKELRRVKASELLPSPKNWRSHPDDQANALRGVLAEVGWADAVIARETPDGLQLIDGHLRSQVAADDLVPTLIVDLTDDEADLVLATHDPLAAMAESDNDKLESLLGEVQSNSEALTAMLRGLANEHGIVAPEFLPTDISEQGRLDETKPYNCPHCGEEFLLRDCK